MTTMELNLRKENLYDLIKDMDEERLSKLENYIKRLCPSWTKKAVAYPWAPSEHKLLAYIQQAREDVRLNQCISNEELSKEMETW